MTGILKGHHIMIAKTEENCLPAPLIAACQNTRTDKENIYHVTSLIDAPLIRTLQQKYSKSVYANPVSTYFAMIGTVAHKLIEEVCKTDMFSDDYLSEFKMVLPFTVQTITKGEIMPFVSGTIDLYDKKKCELVDFKFSTVKMMDNPNTEWNKQLNVYAYMLEELGYPVKKISVCLMARNWIGMRAMVDKKYPQSPYKMLDIPMWTNRARKEYIHQRLTDHIDNPMRECTYLEKWDKDMFAVKIKGQKAAHSAKIETYGDAVNIIEGLSQEKKEMAYIEDRRGCSIRCNPFYCSVYQFCPYRKEDFNE